MKVLIVLAHPEAKSFNAQMADTARAAFEHQGHSVEIDDLYGQDFDPRESPAHFPSPRSGDYFSAMVEQRHASDAGTLPADVAREIGRLERADLVMFQFPLWWFSMPAMLKGWLDRVFVWGRIYSSRRRYDTGYFAGKRAFVSVTTGAPPSAHGPDGRNGDLDLELWPLHFSLHYVGLTVLPPFRAHAVESVLLYSDAKALQERLDGHKAALRTHVEGLSEAKPLAFNGWEDWDESGRLKPGAPVYSPFMRHPERMLDR